MITATILRSEVLKQMDSGEPFTLEFVTADRKRGTGGELVKVENWTKMKGDAVNERKPGASKPLNPSTSQHIKVVNIYNPHNRIQHPIGVHLLLMQTFNGKRILNG